MRGSAEASKRMVLGEVPAPWTLSFAFAAAVGDVVGLTSDGPPLRIPIILVLLGAAFSQDCLDATRRGRPQLSYFAPLLLLVMWTIFLASYAWSRGQFSLDALVILVVPAALGVGLITSLLRKRPESQSNENAGWALAVTSSSYVLLGGVNALFSPQGAPPQALSHERLFMLILVFCLPWLRFGRVVRVATVLAAAIAIFRYPSATVVISLGVAAAVVVLLRVQNPSYRLVTFLASLLVGALLTIPAQTAISTFYGLVGRIDNSATREHLWAQAIAVIDNAPFWGGAFSVPITGFANINGQTQPVPFHNSFLTLGVAGGLVLVALFTTVLASAYVAQVLEMTTPRIAISLLPALSAGVVTLSVNPTLDRFSTSIALYAITSAASLKLRNQSGRTLRGRLEWRENSIE